MKRVLWAGATALLLATSSAWAANEWGIEYEEKARLEAKVVDLLCEVAGDCAEGCGQGKRQLGLLLDDGTLVPVVKNFDPFAGGTADLIEYCGKQIVADGLMIRDPQMPMFAIQFKRLAPDGKWSRANQWSKDWSAAHGGQKANQWFRKDPTVVEHIEANGPYGLPGVQPSE